MRPVSALEMVAYVAVGVMALLCQRSEVGRALPSATALCRAIVAASVAIMGGGLVVTAVGAATGRSELVPAGLLHAGAAAATLAVIRTGTARLPLVRGLRSGAPISWLAVAAAFQVLAWTLDPLPNRALTDRVLSHAPTAWDLGETYLLMAAVAVLAVGAGVRRDAHAVAKRLGVSRLRPGGLLVAVGLGVLTWIGGTLLQHALTLEPTSCLDQIHRLAGIGDTAARNPVERLALVTVVSLGEDMLCRGAVQPRLGLVAGAVLSALLTVYTCDGLPTLGQAYILVLSLCFGVIRSRLGLTASMTTHATYNLMILML